MKILYLDCGMGAAGDMLTGALAQIITETEGIDCSFLLNEMKVPDVVFWDEKLEKCGIVGTHIAVLVRREEELPSDGNPYCRMHGHSHGSHEESHRYGQNHGGHGEGCVPVQAGSGHGEGHPPVHHHHSHLSDICEIVEKLQIPEEVKRDVMAIYRIIAQAESDVHGKPVTDIHFHEVGTMDAIADIAGFCTLLRRLSPDRIVASPVHVGNGNVTCAHGILPVPAPATARILKGIPVYGGEIEGELCTPTGAALLRYFVDEYGPMPVMRTTSIGYGMGIKDFPRANCVRAMLGETFLPSGPGVSDSNEDGALASSQKAVDTIWELKCNLDDMTGEEMGYAMEAILKAGALDVFTIPIGMKKNRPGILFTVLCNEEKKEEMIRLMFLHTTTLGIRTGKCYRAVLDRSVETWETSLGVVRMKKASGYGVERAKPEYEDLCSAAEGCRVCLKDAERMVYEEILNAKKELIL